MQPVTLVAFSCWTSGVSSVTAWGVLAFAPWVLLVYGPFDTFNITVTTGFAGVWTVRHVQYKSDHNREQSVGHVRVVLSTENSLVGAKVGNSWVWHRLAQCFVANFELQKGRRDHRSWLQNEKLWIGTFKRRRRRFKITQLHTARL